MRLARRLHWLRAMKTNHIAPVLALALATLPACASDPADEPIGSTTQASLTATLQPATINSSDTSSPQANEYAYTGSAGLAGSGWLVVFLHGRGCTPSQYTDFMAHANSLGFHVIGISYPTTAQGMQATCGTDTACPGLVHQEVWDGSPVSPVIDVAPLTSIKDRIDSFLTYLNTTYPSGGWNNFITSGHPKWPQIVLVGHSQGSSNTAFIAQKRALHRAVMISGPADDSDWTDDPLLVSASNMFGLQHTADTTAPYASVTQNWDTFGMAGPPYCVDPLCLNIVCSPLLGQYCSKRQLRTQRTVSNPHNDIVMDSGNAADYQAAWTYLLTRYL